MKKILFAALVLLSAITTSCNKPTDQVLVRFQNTTDQDINDAVYEFYNTHFTNLGSLPAETTSDYFPFEYFEIGAGLPMGSMSGKLEGADFWAYAGLWCGTGVEFSQLEPGKYTVVISKIGADNTSEYKLKFAE